MEDKETIIQQILNLYHKERMEELPDKALLCILDILVSPGYGGAMKIYKESNKKERKAFMEDVWKCIKGEAEITYYFIDREGVVNVDGTAEFATPHSVWYKIIPIHNNL